MDLKTYENSICAIAQEVMMAEEKNKSVTEEEKTPQKETQERIEKIRNKDGKQSGNLVTWLIVGAVVIVILSIAFISNKRPKAATENPSAPALEEPVSPDLDEDEVVADPDSDSELQEPQEPAEPVDSDEVLNTETELEDQQAETEDPPATTSETTDEVKAHSQEGSLDFFSGTVDLSNPIDLPDFIEDPIAWMMEMTPQEREDIVSEALGVTVWEIADEAGVAYAFNGDGLDPTDFPSIKGLFNEVHLTDNSIVYYAAEEGSLSDFNLGTRDATVRIAYYLRGEIGPNGYLCLPYWNSVKYNSMYNRIPIPIGYFAANCLPIPEQYISEPILVETFHMLQRVTGTDLTRWGEREGVWYFRSDRGSQDMVCPEGWVCYGTTDPASGKQEFNEFTGTAEDLTAAYIFDVVDDSLNDVKLTQADINSFLRDYNVTTN